MWLDDLADLLEDASVGEVGVTIFKGRPPEDPHELVALIPYGGAAPERTHSGTDRRFPRVQVMARSFEPDQAVAKAEAARSAFRAAGTFSVGSAYYEAILPLGEPSILAHDLRGRVPVVSSFEVRWHAS